MKTDPAKSGSHCYVVTYHNVYEGRDETFLYAYCFSSLEKAMAAKMLVNVESRTDIMCAPRWDEPVYTDDGEFMLCNGWVKFAEGGGYRAVILKEIID